MQPLRTDSAGLGIGMMMLPSCPEQLGKQRNVKLMVAAWIELDVLAE